MSPWKLHQWRQSFLRFLRSPRQRAGLLACLSLLVCLLLPPQISRATAPISAIVAATPDQTGRDFYRQEQYQAAAVAFQQAAQEATARGDRPAQAMALANLSLSLQQLNDWQAAEQAIAQSLEQLAVNPSPSLDEQRVLAQALNIQGRLQYSQGQSQEALLTWQQATDLFQRLNELDSVVQTQLNQVQAMQALGLFRRAIDTLTQVNQTLSQQPESLNKAIALRSLGDALRVAGSLEDSQQVLQQSLTIARNLQQPVAIAAAQLSLGNTYRAQVEQAAALAFYTQASTHPSTRLRAQLNQFSLLTETGQPIPPALQQELPSQLSALPPSRSNIYGRINYVQSLLKSGQLKSSQQSQSTTVALLQTAVAQSRSLGDRRAESYSLGTLGAVYEQAGEWTESIELTQRALLLAEQINASDVSYQWYWQLGRIYQAQNQRGQAIIAYRDAFQRLRSLRADLASANPDVQFSFRQQVEPVYRNLVDLLLQPANTPEQPRLQEARQVVEALRAAELENFLQTACADASRVDEVVDQLDPTAAVIYPIILGDRLEVILKLPGEPNLVHYPPTRIRQDRINASLRQLQLDLQEAYTFRAVQRQGRQVYDWLIAPAEAQLSQKQIKTLVFVLDGPLRNIPMAALYDGQRYLVERFATAQTLGLQIADPQFLPPSTQRVLATSLTVPPPEFRDRFARLENVNAELDAIQRTGMPNTLLRDEKFTRPNVNRDLNQTLPSIVHLATHGTFGATRNTTFLLTAESKVTVDDLGTLFRTRNAVSPIELLILSACRTATGNDREVLGIAGSAIRAGARSAIASLWSLDDESGVQFTAEFYRALREGTSRAEALRRAQVKLLTDQNTAHPLYWAPFILVGSWL